MKKEPLTESAKMDSTVQIDEEQHVIRGVKLLGRVSRNNRRYLDTSLDDSVRLSANRPVYVESHVDDDSKRPLARNGAIVHPRRNGDGNIGDWQLLASHPTTAIILETARRFPANFALSHEVRDYEAEFDKDGVMEVSRITDLGDYALVTEGGTNRSLFEKLENEMEIKTVAELKAQYPKLTEELAADHGKSADEARKKLQEEIAKLAVTIEEQSSKISELEASLKEYTDREEEQKRRDLILAAAREIIGEEFQVKEGLMNSMLKLDEDGYKQCFTEIASAQASKGSKQPVKPECTSGTAGGAGSSYIPVNRVGRVNRR